MTPEQPSVLFICGSMNQTTQMHAVARNLPGMRAAFSSYYGDAIVELWSRWGLIEFSIGGRRHRQRCVEYLRDHGLTVDECGARGSYDLVVTSSDVIVPKNVRSRPLVAVQEGILDPEGFAYRLARAVPLFPRWIAGTACTGLSGAFDKLCVASEGYRAHFVERGVPSAKIAVTGIPNFDDCEKFRNNMFPHHGYVLVCTSDARETFKRDDRGAFIRKAVAIANGRPLLFKLHPNENAERAVHEIATFAPSALVIRSGCAEEMVANADVVVCQYSTLAFVALALGKEVHSFWSLADLQRLLPVQNRSAALRIADVCRGVLQAHGRAPLRARASGGPSPMESAA